MSKLNRTMCENVLLSASLFLWLASSASSGTSGLAGAGAALPPGDASAHIDVIQDDMGAAPKGTASANQTIIPF